MKKLEHIRESEFHKLWRSYIGPTFNIFVADIFCFSQVGRKENTFLLGEKIMSCSVFWVISTKCMMKWILFTIRNIFVLLQLEPPYNFQS